MSLKRHFFCKITTSFYAWSYIYTNFQHGSQFYLLFFFFRQSRWIWSSNYRGGICVSLLKYSCTEPLTKFLSMFYLFWPLVFLPLTLTHALSLSHTHTHTLSLSLACSKNICCPHKISLVNMIISTPCFVSVLQPCWRTMVKTTLTPSMGPMSLRGILPEYLSWTE